MTLNDYLTQFKKNMQVMSGREDTPELVSDYTEQALRYMFDNRRRNFKSAKELGELLLETEEITRSGAVRKESPGVSKAERFWLGIAESLRLNRADSLRRDGTDNIWISNSGKKKLPAAWVCFLNIFYWMLTSQSFEVEEIAAFSEYVVHIAARSLTENSGRTSMLISTYVFMRFDFPCPEYTSGYELYYKGAPGKIRTASDLYKLPGNARFRRFVSYYLSICPSRDLGITNDLEKAESGSYIYHLTGNISGERSCEFRQNIEHLYDKQGDIRVVFDCSTLAWIDMEGINVLADLKVAGRQFMLKNLNADCKVLFRVEGFDEYLDEGDKLPKIDLSRCEKINEGADGIIYRVSDEVIAKTFKDEPNYFDIVRRRLALKNALICGVPAPFTFGYAEYEGKIVTLMELINAKPLLQILASEEDCDGYIIRYAQFIRQLHEIRDEERLKHFMRNLLAEEILSKADRCDRVLPEECRGRARKIIEAVDGPECLVHGDIHPNNIMVSGDEMMLIDFDSFSTGKAVYDLGTLYRALLCHENKGITDYNAFLKLSFDKCRRIWELFIAEYHKDEQKVIARRQVAQAKLIGTVIALAGFIKRQERPEIISVWASELLWCLAP